MCKKFKLLWDFMIQTDHLISARQPDSKKKKLKEIKAPEPW